MDKQHSDRYGDRWDKPFLFLAHSGTRGTCCWCLVRLSEEIHHAMYEDDRGAIKDREIIGKHIFPVCKKCHSKTNQEGVHGRQQWISRKGNLNHNTDVAYDRLLVGYKLLSG